ncbi:IstB ATP binding domain-containing protein, partial [Pseudomonas syringae pv. actinidiae ICMP 18883]
GRFAKLMAGYAKTDLLILDDWGLAPFTAAQRRDMLELLDDRYGNRSTLVTSQMPVDKWHALIGDPTLGDAILDRLDFRLTMQTCVAALRLPVQVDVGQVSK